MCVGWGDGILAVNSHIFKVVEILCRSEDIIETHDLSKDSVRNSQRFVGGTYVFVLRVSEQLYFSIAPLCVDDALERIR